MGVTPCMYFTNDNPLANLFSSFVVYREVKKKVVELQ
jgi:hypothetical protein